MTENAIREIEMTATIGIGMKEKEMKEIETEIGIETMSAGIGIEIDRRGIIGTTADVMTACSMKRTLTSTKGEISRRCAK